MLDVAAHLLHFVAAQARDLLEPRGVRLPRSCRARIAVLVVRHCAVHFEKFERFLDGTATLIHHPADVINRQRPALFHRREHGLHHLHRRERRADEIIRNLVVLAAAQENSERGIHRATGATDLLVIRDHRAGPLKMNHKTEVGFVETHAERNGGDERLDFVVEQLSFGFDAFDAFEVRVIGAGGNVVRLQPRGDAARVLNRQAIDDAVARQLRKKMREPREPVGLMGERDVVELERRTHERAAQNLELRNLRFNVAHHAVVGGGGRAKHRHARRQQLHHAHDAAVVRAEIVPPIRDAMRLVHDEQADAPLQQRQELAHELRVGQPFRRHHEQVQAVVRQRRFNRAPVLHVLTVNRGRAHAEFFRGEKLVAHQRQQRTDQQRRAGTRVAQNSRREKIDDALAPARALDDEQSAALVRDLINRLPLAVAELRARAEHPLQERICQGCIHDARMVVSWRFEKRQSVVARAEAHELLVSAFPLSLKRLCRHAGPAVSAAPGARAVFRGCHQSRRC